MSSMVVIQYLWCERQCKKNCKFKQSWMLLESEGQFIVIKLLGK